ncbi:MAG TPA: tRNA (guanosine(37)-N1)-methyltransferase TrmD [Syntrophomonas sp.]|jgi:tRNA (guanine37-N1)-methyltransferase|nr:tRNA (guanosine(37)-N1)-methyltransferase TrmD [Syntrophomonas sp.]
MKIDILTLFPDMFISPFNESIIKRARERELVTININNIRDFALDRHMQVDDYPYGGGAGMVMKPDVLSRAIDAVSQEDGHVIYMSPRGKYLTQSKAAELARVQNLVILCGHYEGIDERVLNRVDEEISIGDYVLTGGEIPAMVLVDAVVRLIPGVLGDDESSVDESFSDGLLEYPQYTRPAEFEEQTVPEVLLSGHHENIRLWRKRQSLMRTLLTRPELLLARDFSDEEKVLLEDIIFNRESSQGEKS